MLLAVDCGYEIEITAEYDGAADVTYTQTVVDRGTWRFVPSGLIGPGGALLLSAGNGDSVSAAMTGVSIIHHAPIQMRSVQWTLTNWVSLREGRAA